MKVYKHVQCCVFVRFVNSGKADKAAAQHSGKVSRLLTVPIDGFVWVI